MCFSVWHISLSVLLPRPINTVANGRISSTCPLPPEKAMAPHSSTLAWKIPWTEEPGRLQSMGSLRIGHDWATSLSLFTFMHWRRKWQPTPVLLPGEFQGRGSLVGLPSVGSHRVGHDWIDLAAAAAAVPYLRVLTTGPSGKFPGFPHFVCVWLNNISLYVYMYVCVYIYITTSSSNNLLGFRTLKFLSFQVCFIFLNIYLFIFAVSGFSCGMWDLSLQHRLLSSCGICRLQSTWTLVCSRWAL